MIGSIINFKSPDGSTNFYLNDQTSLNSSFLTSPHYYIKVESADYAGTDLSIETHELPHTPGEFTGDILRRGRGVTLSGSIVSRGMPDLEAGANYLSEVFWDTRDRQLVWTPFGLTTSVYLICHVVNDLSIARNIPQTFTNPQWNWTVGLRASDPVIYKTSDDTQFYSWQTPTIDTIEMIIE